MKNHNLLELFTAVSFISGDKMLRGLSIFLLIVLNLISTQTSAQENEYLDITRERVNSALRPRASMTEVKLAEASLTGLGWLTLYGSDDNSFQLAQELNQIVFDRYSGTDMSEVMTSHTSEAYFEMLNLNRFGNTPVVLASDYINIVEERVTLAMEYGAGYDEFVLAEGSLAALGWLALYGNDNRSLKKATSLMETAARLWPRANDVYMLQSSTAYSEMINLDRFTNQRSSASSYDYPVLSYQSTCPEGFPGCVAENICKRCDQSCGGRCQNTGEESCGPQDCMSCGQGKILHTVYDDGSGECIDGPSAFKRKIAIPKLVRQAKRRIEPKKKALINGGFKSICPSFIEGCSQDNLCRTCNRSCGEYCQDTGEATCGADDCMSCPPGKVLNPLYGDGTGKCIDGAQGVLNNVIDARTLLNAMASTIVGKRVFVTSNLYNGDLGGVDGANAICNKHATDAGLEGWYKAWLSDGRTHPAKSFSKHSMPYVRTDGVQVSVNFDGLLDGNIDAAIDRDEFGRELEPKWGAWTGTKENGRSERKHCKRWTNSDSADGFHGCSSSSSYAWSSCGQNNCSNDYALYCVEQ